MTGAKPVLILQHLSTDGPAWLGTWLAQQGAAVDVRNTAAGDAFPETIEPYAALAILGGEMSANDPLPSLRQAERLFLQAHARGVPTLGHCLGGQLMARALGATVGDSPAPEIGWQKLAVADSDAARLWFGQPGEHTVFQWHFEAFSLPAGAEPLAGSGACPHQAFAIGPHLGMQFHVEVDAAKIDAWSHEDGERWSAAMACATVQDGAAMRAGTTRHLAAQQALAGRIYARWRASWRT